jgi:putative IMPACT (imprinted ancient) family translation regulator
MISVLQGQDLGDEAVVVTRYFGGTKLGSGGLVRAKSGAVRELLKEMPRTMKVERVRRELILDYSRYEPVRQFVLQREGEIEEERFTAEVMIRFTLPVDRTGEFDRSLTELSHGQVEARTIT